MAVNPHTLFEVIFKLVLKERAKLIPSVDAVVMFTVTGEVGGCWVLDMRRGGSGDVQFGRIDKPDLEIVIRHDFLDNFVRGNYELLDALKRGVMGLNGSLDKFRAFATFLAGTKALQISEGLSAAPHGMDLRDGARAAKISKPKAKAKKKEGRARR